jgi:hypothetical protein
MEIHNLNLTILTNRHHQLDLVECIQISKGHQIMVYVMIYLFNSLKIIFLFLQGGPPGSSFQQPGFYPQDQQSIILASLEQYQGTIVPAPNFNPDADCQALSHAMQGAGKSNMLIF